MDLSEGEGSRRDGLNLTAHTGSATSPLIATLSRNALIGAALIKL